jgi:hypothetical protein
MDQLELVEGLIDLKRSGSSVMSHLQHTVEHVRSDHGAPFRRGDLQRVARGRPRQVAQRRRQFGERTLAKGVDNRLEVSAQLLLAGEAGVGQAGVVEVMRKPRQEARRRLGAVIGRQQDAVDRDDEAVVAVALGRLQLQTRPAGSGRAGARLRAQPSREGWRLACGLLLAGGARNRFGDVQAGGHGDLPDGLCHQRGGALRAEPAGAQRADVDARQASRRERTTRFLQRDLGDVRTAQQRTPGTQKSPLGERSRRVGGPDALEGTDLAEQRGRHPRLHDGPAARAGRPAASHVNSSSS